ncbi:hypothetical protein BV22DRAFT_1134835 [Leucogyrophana mollusca]|uniref:Uncharacterized protein n=1 Tax=Leucogyrophana mollusca TaxID=85980 RepID=A0ACB8AXM1_9AGAM|nr:hypothetical protein BV22DRAFT_1134835 [Leucogyrophana mollusca]
MSPHISTLDSVYKMNAVPVPLDGQLVTDMDVSMRNELAGLMVIDPGKDHLYGAMINEIFLSFDGARVSPTDLHVAVGDIRPCDRNDHMALLCMKKGPHDKIPLYDSATHRWNWAIPERQKRAERPSRKAKKMGRGNEMGEEDDEGDGDDDGEARERTSAEVGETRAEEAGETTSDQAGEMKGNGDEMSHNAESRGKREQTDEKCKGAMKGKGQKGGKKTPESILAAFLNAVVEALIVALGKLDKDFKPPLRYRVWSPDFSTRLINSGEFKRKPNLILLDQEVRRTTKDDGKKVMWMDTKAVGELTVEAWTPSTRIGKTVDTKAYLMMREQPWKRFCLALSFANSQLRVHLYDHSGCVVSPPFDIHKDPAFFLHVISAVSFGNPQCLGFDPTIHITLPRIIPESLTEANLPVARAVDQSPNRPLIGSKTPPTPHTSKITTLSSSRQSDTPIGWIQVNDNRYNILTALFLSHGLVGRGTCCYLVMREGQRFVIKDSWVVSGMNEAKMLEAVNGIRGVPTLVESCVVKVDGKDDVTERYRPQNVKNVATLVANFRTHIRLVTKPHARPLTEFKTKKELVSCLRDIVETLKLTTRDRGILHRDLSVRNVMIVDNDEGMGEGHIIDWELAVKINDTNEYQIWGAGTLPFLSVAILKQLIEISNSESRVGNIQARKKKLLTVSAPPTSDAISRVIVHTPTDNVESVLYIFMWICIRFSGPGCERADDSSWMYKNSLVHRWARLGSDNIKLVTDSKMAFTVFPNRGEELIDDQFAPYFDDLKPLGHTWLDVHRRAVQQKRVVTHDEVISTLNDFLAIMSDHEIPWGLDVAKKELRQDSEVVNKAYAGLGLNTIDFNNLSALEIEQSLNGVERNKRTRDEIRTTPFGAGVVSKRFRVSD